MKTLYKGLALVLAVILFASFFGCAASKTPTLDKIKKAGKLVMLTNAAFPPFEYLGDDNNVAGVDADIAAAIAAELGVKLEIIDMDFDGIIMAVQSGKGDLGVAGMTATEERAKSVDFSVDYVSTTQMIIVPQGSPIKTAEDLSGKNVGVQLDAIVIDAMPADQIVAANAGLVLLDEPLTEEQYAIAIKKGNDDLKEVVNKVLEKLLKDGTVDALIEKHMAAAAN